MAARGPQNGRQVWEGVYYRQISLNKFFDPNTSSMRKVDNRGKTSLPVDRLNANQLERRPLVPIDIISSLLFQYWPLVEQ